MKSEKLQFGNPKNCSENQGSLRDIMKYVRYFILQLLFCYNCIFDKEEKKRPLLRGRYSGAVGCRPRAVKLGDECSKIFVISNLKLNTQTPILNSHNKINTKYQAALG